VREAHSLSAEGAVVAALALALVLVWLGLRASALLARVLKASGIELVSRVVGLLLAAIAVQLVATGAYAWAIHGIGG
jgi:multiple antibiotic resistance protein